MARTRSQLRSALMGLILGLVGAVLGPGSALGQTGTADGGARADGIGELDAATARTLEALLERAAIAEDEGRFADAVSLYREASAVLPLDEYRLGEAYSLERAGSAEEALAVWRALQASPRAEVRAAADAEGERLASALAWGQAGARVAEALPAALGASSAAAAISEARSEAAAAAGEPWASAAEERSLPGRALPDWALASAVGAGASLATAITLAVLSDQRERDLTEYLADPAATAVGAQALRDQSDGLGTGAVVTFGVAGALAATAIVLWLVEDGDGDGDADGGSGARAAGVSLTPSVSWAGEPGASLLFRF